MDHDPSLLSDEELLEQVNDPVFAGTTGRSRRNNNPLNLEYRPGSYQDKYKAELEPEGRFAVFPSMEAGYSAGLEQIKLDTERGHTLKSFVHKFAPSHENPTDDLIKQYSKHLGVEPDTPLSNILPEELIIPMLKRESSTKITNAERLASKIGGTIPPSQLSDEALLRQIEEEELSKLSDEELLKMVAPKEPEIKVQAAIEPVKEMAKEEQPPMLDPFAQAEVSGALELAGKGLGWAASRPREWLLEPTIGKAYDALAPLIGAPTDKGFVSTTTSLESMVRPGEFGQVGGEKASGTVEYPAITPREVLMLGGETKLLGLASRIPAIRAASKEGTLTRFKEMRSPELLWDNPELGAVVYQKPFKTAVDSTIGPIGTEVTGPILREGHAIMSQQLADAKIAGPWQFGQKWKRDFGTSLKTNERILSELNDFSPGVKQEFYTNIKASENVAYRQAKLAEEDIKKLETITGGHEVGDRLGIIAISEREGGVQALKSSGIKKFPKATELDRTVINEVRNKFYGTLERINEGRTTAGLEPIPTDINYVTFMRNIVENEINPVLAKGAELKKALIKQPSWTKERVGGTQEIATNLFDIYKNYTIQAERHLNLSPHVEKINKFVLEEMVLPDGTKVAPLAETNPRVADALLQYGKSISGGYGQAFSESWGWLERGISALSNNVVVSMIAAYPRSVLNQLGAITGAATKVRPDRLISGMNKALTPEGWKLAMKESRALGQRRMDVVFEDVFGGGKTTLSELKHKGMLPLETTDSTVAVGVWNGALKEAEAAGLKGRKAYDWADQVVAQTQGSASAIDRSNFQRTMAGKSVSGLQTFTIADWNLWMREIFGIGNKNKTFAQKGASLASALAVGTAMNLYYRNVMGMTPPNPEPIEAYMKAKNEGASEVAAIGSVGKEIASKYAPLVGSMAMGKTPFGPLGSLVSETAQGYRSLPELAASLAGVPGTNPVSRLYRSEPGMEFRAKLEDLTTLPLAQRTPLKLPPMTAREALLGRLDIPPTGGPGKWDLWLRDRMGK